MLKAAIDIGSNSVLLSIAKMNDDGTFDELAAESTITKLGSGLKEHQEFLQESMDDTLDALKNYFQFINKFQVPQENILITATEAARLATNSSAFFQKIHEMWKTQVIILNPKGEAYYSGLGVIQGLNLSESPVTIVDIGGASTEIIKTSTNPFNIIDYVSLKIGSVVVADCKSSKDSKEKIHEELNKNKEKIESLVGKKIIGNAGTINTLTMILNQMSVFNPHDIQNSTIEFGDLKKWVDDFENVTSKSLLKKYPFIGKRSSTIWAGALILSELNTIFNNKDIIVSYMGLRHGLLMSGGISNEFYFS